MAAARRPRRPVSGVGSVVPPHLRRTRPKPPPAAPVLKIVGPIVGPVIEVLEELDDNDPLLRPVREARAKRAAADAEARGNTFDAIPGTQPKTAFVRGTLIA